MAITLKKLADQTLVITGASSGIGLVTARRAVERGARVVLAARSEDALRRLIDDITDVGGEAVYVVADVREPDDVRRIARAAQGAFGGFDTWVNDAGISIYGRLDETPVEDMRALFETNLWGLVYGSLEAARHLRQRGGAIINIGSVLSDRAILLQGIYSASKHAVEGFTDALRMELEEDGAPVSVTLVKPSAVNTPYTVHAKNYMDEKASLPPPVYAPDVVARAILHCAEHAQREVAAGSGGRQLAALGYHAPGTMDWLMRTVLGPQEKTDGQARPLAQNGLDRPSGRLRERGPYDGHVTESSLYTQAMLHPGRALLAVAAVGASVALAAYARA